MTKLAAISVDLDEIDCYAAIHGFAGKDLIAGEALRAVYRRALPRLVSLFEELDVPVTFFAIGRDLAHADNRASIRALHQRGHEIANHSLSHLYDLTRRSRAEQQTEVVGGADAIEVATGARPEGFRAPGYTITDQLFEVLRAAGVRYDSSVFPCPAYYAAKVSAIGLIRARGRQSRSVVDNPRVLEAPGDPYRIGNPYFRRGTGLVELPIGVTKTLSGRLPFIGTSVVLSTTGAARLLTRLASARDFVNLELHGIDLADADLDGLEALAPHQRDLRKSWKDKRASLVAAVEVLRARGFGFVTLAEASRRVAA